MSYSDDLKNGKWQQKRLQIMERDSFKCLSCGSENKLTVHHLYYKHGCKPWEYPDKSLVTLCETCHNELHEKHAELAGNLAFEMLTGLSLEHMREIGQVKQKSLFGGGYV